MKGSDKCFQYPAVMIKTVHTLVTNSAMLTVFVDLQKEYTLSRMISPKQVCGFKWFSHLNFTKTAIKHHILTRLQLRRFTSSTATTTKHCTRRAKQTQERRSLWWLQFLLSSTFLIMRLGTNCSWSTAILCIFWLRKFPVFRNFQVLLWPKNSTVCRIWRRNVI